MTSEHKDPVFVSKNITISNANFQTPDPSIKNNLCILKEGQYNPETEAIAFSVYIQRGNPEDADSYGVLTCIFLIPNSHADKIKKTIQLGALKKLVDDKYFSTLSAIYKTDLAATAAFVANFNALATTLGFNEIPANASQDDYKTKWDEALKQAPLLQPLMDCLREGGPYGIEGFYWLLNEDLTAAMSDSHRDHPSGTTKNLTLLLRLHQ
jgi:hypothetical protein